MFQKYINAANLKDAIEILEQEKGSARVIAGATDLMLEMERGARNGIHTLVDISRARDCNQITLDEDLRIHIGPMVTHNQAAGSKLIRELGLPLALACWSVGSPQIRNRGTIAGNVITASPANDTIPALMVLNASVTLTSSRGKRVVALKDFYLGVRKTVLAEDELLEEISFPALTATQKGVFLKSALRQAQAISVVNFAAVLDLQAGKIQSANLALGSVAPTIIRATSAEEFLAGKPLSSQVIESAALLAVGETKPIADLRGSDIYRKSSVKNAIRDGLALILKGNQEDSLPIEPIFLQGKKPFQVTSLTETRTYTLNDKVHPKINGKDFTGKTAGHPNLLRFIRDEAGLTGSKEGCAEGECGACTVYLDGSAVMGCLVPVFRADQANIETVESLSPDGKSLHPVQQAFIEEGAVQCGYCTPGFIMSAAKLLEEKPKPSREEIKQAMTGNLCRCTGYYQIINAVENASIRMG
jgi:xanthine dehydrogenase iron-sulfur cluster and FAD-binding subunit A